MAGCTARTPMPPALPQTHSTEWEENVHTLYLPTVLPAEPTESIFTPEQDEEQEAQTLVAQQAGPKIDLYFYAMNRWYRQEQAVFILKNRRFYARQQQGNIYDVTCTAAARTGVDEKHTHAVEFPCGVWKVDIGLRIVLPQDKKAETIWAE